MIDIDRIEKYILGGKWENQYPQAIEELLAEVKRLKKLALEAYQTPMNTGKEKCRIIELLSEMIH